MRINIIGQGNVGTHLTHALHEAGHQVTPIEARQQATSLPDADLCIISVKDDVISAVAERFIPLCPNAIWVHTAGSIPMNILQDKGARQIGVFYPMQTFSKEKAVDFTQLSIFLEAGAGLTTTQDGSAKLDSTKKELEALAHTLTNKVYWLDSVERCHLHLAAVFACNFVNHCYTLSENVLHEIDVPFDAMLPLVRETANKVAVLTPREAQTGPAIRHDESVMALQRKLLEGKPRMQNIYDILSESIQQTGNQGV